MNPRTHSRNQDGRQELAIAPVAHRLLGKPSWVFSTKTEWRYGGKGSLAVDLKKNAWFDHEAGEGGGVLDLVCRERGGTHQEAHEWLRGEGLVDCDLKAAKLSQGSDFNADRHPYGLKIWDASVDANRTEVETYLRQARGIRLLIPPSLRFHAHLKHGPTDLCFPALVAGVQAPDGEVIAIHRTYLQPGGHGKAEVSTKKMTLGSLEDGAVRLAPAEKSLGLAEGIETGLSAQQLFEIPVWACLSSGRYNSVAIPDQVIEIHIFADNGDAGRDAAKKAAEHWTVLGKRVVVRRPPDIFGDWNDVLPHWHERPVGEWEF
jgi:hypothetical protein